MNKTPLDHGLISLEDYLNKQSLTFKDGNFLSSVRFQLGNEIDTGDNKSRLIQINDFIARVDIKDGQNAKYCTVIPRIGGIVVSNYVITKIFNNNTNERNNVTYEVDLKEAISGKTKLVSFGYDDLNNYRTLKTKLGVLSILREDECAEFTAEFICKNNPIRIKEYSNPGRIVPDCENPDYLKNEWLWSNAAYIDGRIYTSDDKGNIKVSNKEYIRLAPKQGRFMPKLIANEKTIESVIVDLFENIYDSWNGAIEPYLAFSYMAMSVFCQKFWKKSGFCAIAFIGDTEAGKTEITGLGLGLFGLNKFFMSSTRNTLFATEHKLNSVNNIPIIIDDTGKAKLSGENFIDELKRITHGLDRDKGKNGTETFSLPICTSFGFSSNYLPVEKPEIMNRILYLDTENLSFDPTKFKYFQKGAEELSCILPHILKFGYNRIEKLHNDNKQMLLSKYKGISDRMVSHIAIALSGIYMFAELSQNKAKIPFDKLSIYVEACMKRFKQTQSPLGKLLEAMPILIWERRIQEGMQYKLNSDNLTILTLHKTAICHAYNRYFASDKSEYINSRQIKNNDSETYKILKFNKTQDFKGEKHNSIVIDITNHPSCNDILMNHQKITEFHENNFR